VVTDGGRPSAGGDVDAVVVGGGPSGLAAATWIARHRRSVVVVDSGEHRADSVERSHGYLGRDPDTPRELLTRGREEVLAYPHAAVCEDRVEGVERRGDGRFDVTLAGGTAFAAARVVLACGVRDVTPDIEGFAEHYGATAFHCPSCDGYEARDQDVVCVGWDSHLAGFAAGLLRWASSVTVLTSGRRFDGDDAARARLARLGVEVVEEPVTCLLGSREHLEGVRLSSGRRVPAALLFFSLSHEPRADLAERLGCDRDDEGYVRVNDCGQTSVEGVYACGDLVPGLQLTPVAAATGVVAGVAVAQSLSGPEEDGPGEDGAAEAGADEADGDQAGAQEARPGESEEGPDQDGRGQDGPDGRRVRPRAAADARA